MRNRTSRSICRRQSGAVAVMLGLTLAMLIGFAALAIDLGRTYVVRTELQNAADAAALAGAKQLDRTYDGVHSAVGGAVAYAKAIALQHEFNFGTPVTLTNADLSVGSCPDDGTCTMVSVNDITSDALAADKTFLKVDISSGSLATFLGGLVGVPSTATYGRAVAGRFLVAMAPIGVCAIKDPITGESRPAAERLSTGSEALGYELAEYGFRRGVSYNIFELGPLGLSSDPYLLNPVNSYPGTCDPNNSSASTTAPFICTGVTAVMPALPGGYVYGNTGVSAGPIEAALNSRFGVYGGPSVCRPADAPPDGNTREYTPSVAGAASVADHWMSAQPNRQTMLFAEAPLTPIPTAADYGVLWSYSHAVKAAGTASAPTVGADFPSLPASEAKIAWNALYPVPGASAPQPVVDLPQLPYRRDLLASTPPERIDRRVLNLAIADCGPNKVVGSGACSRIQLLAVGKFFMQVRADFSGNPKKLQVEFAGLVNPPPAEILLYR